jgi:hypothetical protein
MSSTLTTAPPQPVETMGITEVTEIDKLPIVTTISCCCSELRVNLKLEACFKQSVIDNGFIKYRQNVLRIGRLKRAAESLMSGIYFCGR